MTIRREGPGGDGELTIDEDRVAAKVQDSRNDAGRSAAIAARMGRYRDPTGSFEDGGCIDTTREFPRQICTGSTQIALSQVWLP